MTWTIPSQATVQLGSLATVNGINHPGQSLQPTSLTTVSTGNGNNGSSVAQTALPRGPPALKEAISIDPDYK